MVHVKATTTPALDSQGNISTLKVHLIPTRSPKPNRHQRQSGHAMSPRQIEVFQSKIAGSMKGMTVRCPIPLDLREMSPFKTMTVEMDNPNEGSFPDTVAPMVLNGVAWFNTPLEAGSALWSAPGIGTGEVTWSAGSIGSVVACDSITVIGHIGFASGSVHNEDGSAAADVTVVGCGGEATADDAGLFELEVVVGECEIHAERQSNTATAAGPTMKIFVRPYASTDGIELLAPPAPSWREPTESEAAQTRRSECEYWLGTLVQRRATVATGLAGSPDLTKHLAALDRMEEDVQAHFCNDGER
jgi:hypothetical protein